MMNEDTTLRGRIDELEARLERQAETITEQRARIDELSEPDRPDPAGGAGGPRPISRRSALAGAGLLGLLGLSGTTAAAGPTGQVGAVDRPLNALYAQEIHGAPSGEGSFDVFAGSDRIDDQQETIEAVQAESETLRNRLDAIEATVGLTGSSEEYQ